MAPGSNLNGTRPKGLTLDLKAIPFVQARNYTRSQRQSVGLIVIHSAENQERERAARRLAEWAAGPDAPRASWHYAVDNREIIQSVRLWDIAWHAPGANSNGVGIELAGRAAQSDEDWADPYSRAVLDLAVLLTAALCKRYGIEPVIVSPGALRAGGHGITTHAFVSKAFKRSTHTDPGEHFPLTWFVSRVAEELE